MLFKAPKNVSRDHSLFDISGNFISNSTNSNGTLKKIGVRVFQDPKYFTKSSRKSSDKKMSVMVKSKGSNLAKH